MKVWLGRQMCEMPHCDPDLWYRCYRLHTLHCRILQQIDWYMHVQNEKFDNCREVIIVLVGASACVACSAGKFNSSIGEYSQQCYKNI